MCGGWCTPVISALRVAEAGGSKFEPSLRETLSQNKGLRYSSLWRPWAQAAVDMGRSIELILIEILTHVE